MSSRPLGFAAHVVYAWTRLYTCRLPPDVRDDRQREIASDLWESYQDADGRDSLPQALHVLGRMLAGMPDDVLWRWEHARRRYWRPAAALGLIVASAVVVAVALWVVDLAQIETPKPAVKAIVYPPPPPPPPPPPRPRSRR